MSAPRRELRVGQDRMVAIASLQPEVRRLQQAIADLDQPPNDSMPRDHSAVEVELAVLQDALNRAQAELAHYQGRI